MRALIIELLSTVCTFLFDFGFSSPTLEDGGDHRDRQRRASYAVREFHLPSLDVFVPRVRPETAQPGYADERT